MLEMKKKNQIMNIQILW